MKKNVILLLGLAAFLILGVPCFAAEGDFLAPNGQPIALSDTGADYTLFLPACCPLPEEEPVTADHEAVSVVRGSLPALFITLEGENDLARIGSSKDEEAAGQMQFYDIDGTLLYDGLIDRMWGHGNSSFIATNDASAKISYNLKLQSKARLIDGTDKGKKYVLIAPRREDPPYNRDTTGMAQLSAFAAWTALAGDRAADVGGRYVDLYVNGEYRGFYVLAERIDNGGALSLADLDEYVVGAGSGTRIIGRHNAGRGDTAIAAGVEGYIYSASELLPGADPTGGYVLEVTCDPQQVRCGFRTALGTLFSIRYPDECTREMVMYIATRVQEFENALCSETGTYNGRHFSEYADLTTLADQILLYGFFLNFEVYQTSTYLYKDAGDVPFTFGPAWDFESPDADLTSRHTFFDTTFTYYGQTKLNFLKQLWRWGDFVAIMAEENRRFEEILPALCDKNGPLAAAAASLADSFAMNRIRWPDTPQVTDAPAYLDAIRARGKRWFGTLWDPAHYLTGASLAVSDNGDGTVTISLDCDGLTTGEPVWQRMADGRLFPFVTGKRSVTVPADGTQYLCSVTGPLNAYCHDAVDSTFSSRYVTMTTFPVSAAMPQDPAKEEETALPAQEEPTPPSGTGRALLLAACGLAVLLLAAGAFALLFPDKPKKH